MACISSKTVRLKEKSTIRTYPSDPDRNVVYDYVMVNPHRQGYDVGVKISKDGEVSLNCDFYNGTIEQSLGKQFATLKKEYVINIVKNEYDDVEILEQLADGSLVLEADDGL